MKPFIRKKLPYILIVVQVILILGLLIYIVPGRYRLYDIVLYDASENVPANPLIGYAPDAAGQEDCEETDLVFLMLPFSEWEPQEGVFDEEGVRAKYHLDEYRDAGKHAVLRFVCDLPDEEGSADVPEWLRDKTGGGTDYEDESGRGYAPPYEDKAFEEAHREALEALALWCGQDSFVAYVEVGSLGKNGDWTDSGEGISPPSRQTCETYLAQYRDAFSPYKTIRLLYSGEMADLNLPVSPAMAGNSESPDSPDTMGAPESTDSVDTAASSGTWKDVLGDETASALWWQTGVEAKPETEEGTDVPSLWTQGPVGGGLTRSVPMDDLLMGNLSDTLEQVRSCHVSFIGPVCPDAVQQQTNGSDMLLRDVGYCVYLSRLQTTVDYLNDDLVFHFTFENIGRAPLYWDWPVTMYVYDKEGKCIRDQVLDLKMSGLIPGVEKTVDGTVPYSRDLLRGYSVGLSIKSPDGAESVTFAQKGVLPDAEGIHMIYRYKPRR